MTPPKLLAIISGQISISIASCRTGTMTSSRMSIFLMGVIAMLLFATVCILIS